MNERVVSPPPFRGRENLLDALVEKRHRKQARERIDFMTHREHLCLRERVAAAVQKLVLIDVDDIGIEEALPVRAVEKMSEILDIADFPLAVMNAVAHIVMALLPEERLTLNLILNPVQIIFMYHAGEDPSGKVQKFLEVAASKQPNDIFIREQDILR